MKILHIVNGNNKITINYAHFIQDNVELNECSNYYYLIGGNKVNKGWSDVRNVIFNSFEYSRKHPIKSFHSIIKLINEINKYDVVIWHSLFLIKDVVYLFSLFKISIAKKSIWMEWGADVYEYQSKHFILNSLYKRFVNNLKAIISIFPGDINYIRKHFEYSGKIYDACYPPSFDDLRFPSLKNVDTKKSEVIVMVGHSANKSLNHIKCIDILSKFKNENIKVFLPINYGDMKYAERVISHAKEAFPQEKLIILDSFVKPDAYNSLLNNVDVCVFDTFRQLGLGNIYYLMACNKSIYLNADGIMYDYFKNIGLSVKRVLDIDKINCVEKLKFTNNNSDNTFIKERFELGYYSNLWNSIFESIVNDKL